MSSHELHASVLRDNGLMMLTLAASLLRELRAIILPGNGLLILPHGVVLAFNAWPTTTAQGRHPRELHAFVLLGACLMKKTTGVVLVSSGHPPRHGGGNLCELHASILRGTDLMTCVVLASSVSPSTAAST